jgi:hypothetical protein
LPQPQIGRQHFGIEGDVAAAGINDTNTVVFPSLLNPTNARNSFTATTNVEALATIRGRVGYSWGPGMFYVTGGGAWGRLKNATTLSSDAAPGVFSAVGIQGSTFGRFGGVVGLGAEWKIAPQWTLLACAIFYPGLGPEALEPCEFAWPAFVGADMFDRDLLLPVASMSVRRFKPLHAFVKIYFPDFDSLPALKCPLGQSRESELHLFGVARHPSSSKYSGRRNLSQPNAKAA